MAQQCMDLMEKKKLLLTANVEQVGALVSLGHHANLSLELRDRVGCGWQSAEDACRRYGPSSGR